MRSSITDPLITRGGCKIVTYAVWWIRHAILKGMSEQSGAMRLPLNKSGAIRRMWRTLERLRQEIGREPTDKEIAAAMKMKVHDIAELKKLSVTSLSLDAPIAADEDRTLLDWFGEIALPPPADEGREAGRSATNTEQGGSA